MTRLGAAVVVMGILAAAAVAHADAGWINSQRAKAGRPAVSSDSSLDRYAAAHSRAMADTDSLWHSNLGNVPGPWAAVAENVGRGNTLASVRQALLSSSGHYKNILGDWTHAGEGSYTAPNGQVYLTQVFVRRPGPSPKPKPKPKPKPPAPTTTTTVPWVVVPPKHELVRCGDTVTDICWS